MEPRTIRLNFDLSFVYGPRTWRAPIMAAMLLAGAGELNSESVTLSTYYPAPSGVYTNMITTDNTFLARDGGNVGIGTTSPDYKLDVGGIIRGQSETGSGDVLIIGNDVKLSDIDIANTAGLYGLQDSTRGSLKLGSGGGTVSGYNGNVGIGTVSPGEKLEVTGNATVSGAVTAGSKVVVTAGYVRVNSVGCAEFDVVEGAVCTGAQYATFSPGFYVEGWSYQNRGGRVLAQTLAGQYSTQVWGLDNCSGGGIGCTGNPAWMTLNKDDSSTHIYCCPR